MVDRKGQGVVNPPVCIPSASHEPGVIECATCGALIGLSSPIPWLTDPEDGVIRMVRVCWDCATLHMENPEALDVQYRIHRSAGGA